MALLRQWFLVLSFYDPLIVFISRQVPLKLSARVAIRYALSLYQKHLTVTGGPLVWLKRGTLLFEEPFLAQRSIANKWPRIVTGMLA